MASELSTAQIGAIKATLSTTRLSTFDAAPGFTAEADALEKYSWHALTSAAFFASLHICEVSVRNAVNEALARTYGADWPWNPTKELLRVRGEMPIGATSKVVAELKFGFWCHMFTSRYQVRIWDSNIRTTFPNIPATYSAPQARQVIYLELDSLRKFRNRIAHHEPILSHPLPQRQTSIQRLVAWRCIEVADWHASWETVTNCLTSKP